MKFSVRLLQIGVVFTILYPINAACKKEYEDERQATALFYNRILEAEAENRAGLFAEPQVCAVLWHRLVFDQRLVLHRSRAWHLVEAPLAGRRRHRLDGSALVPLHAGKDRHGAHCHVAVEEAVPKRPENPRGAAPAACALPGAASGVEGAAGREKGTAIRPRPEPAGAFSGSRRS